MASPEIPVSCRFSVSFAFLTVRRGHLERDHSQEMLSRHSLRADGASHKLGLPSLLEAAECQQPSM